MNVSVSSNMYEWVSYLKRWPIAFPNRTGIIKEMGKQCVTAMTKQIPVCSIAVGSVK